MCLPSFPLPTILDDDAVDACRALVAPSAGERHRFGRSGETTASTTASHYALIWPG